MKMSATTLFAIGATMFAFSDCQAQPATGRIRLEIANLTCAAVSPESASYDNPNPSDLNDGDLDRAETTAIQQGCTLRASAVDGAGTPQSNLQLTLVQAAAPNGEFRPFGNPRLTDAQGNATWRFQPSPNTDFIYEAVSSTPGQSGVRSNSVEIQLCTGESSVGAIEGAPTTDSGQGCQGENDSTGGDDVGDSVSDFLQNGPNK
jgi:hypothetical protein